MIAKSAILVERFDHFGDFAEHDRKIGKFGRKVRPLSWLCEESTYRYLVTEMQPGASYCPYCPFFFCHHPCKITKQAMKNELLARYRPYIEVLFGVYLAINLLSIKKVNPLGALNIDCYFVSLSPWQTLPVKNLTIHILFCLCCCR